MTTLKDILNGKQLPKTTKKVTKGKIKEKKPTNSLNQLKTKHFSLNVDKSKNILNSLEARRRNRQRNNNSQTILSKNKGLRASNNNHVKHLSLAHIPRTKLSISKHNTKNIQNVKYLRINSEQNATEEEEKQKKKLKQRERLHRKARSMAIDSNSSNKIRVWKIQSNFQAIKQSEGSLHNLPLAKKKLVETMEQFKDHPLVASLQKLSKLKMPNKRKVRMSRKQWLKLVNENNKSKKSQNPKKIASLNSSGCRDRLQTILDENRPEEETTVRLQRERSELEHAKQLKEAERRRKHEIYKFQSMPNAIYLRNDDLTKVVPQIVCSHRTTEQDRNSSLEIAQDHKNKFRSEDQIEGTRNHQRKTKKRKSTLKNLKFANFMNNAVEDYNVKKISHAYDVDAVSPTHNSSVINQKMNQSIKKIKTSTHIAKKRVMELVVSSIPLRVLPILPSQQPACQKNVYKELPILKQPTDNTNTLRDIKSNQREREFKRSRAQNKIYREIVNYRKKYSQSPQNLPRVKMDLKHKRKLSLMGSGYGKRVQNIKRLDHGMVDGDSKFGFFQSMDKRENEFSVDLEDYLKD